MQKLLCPKCGDPVGKRGNNRGAQRYGHDRHKHPCKWQGTQPVGLAEAKAAGIDTKASKALHRKIRGARGVQRYVITCAQNATDVDHVFDSLLTYCRVNKAQLIVIPYRYKNPTSHWSKAAEHDDWWDARTLPYLMRERTEIGKHVVILADIMTQPTATTPLQGMQTLAGGRTAIIGHPKLALETVPAPQNKLPAILTTTGACTQKNYIQAKAGKKAEHHHTMGATVLEVNGDVFHLRQLNACRDGSFIDLDREYSGKTHRKAGRAAALVMGDTHQEFVNPDVVNATFGKGGMVDLLNPRNLVWHDVHDFYSRNHHHKNDSVINYRKHHEGSDNVEKALDGTWEFIDKHTRPDIQNVFVFSNHPAALAKWIKETNPHNDPENCVFWAKTYAAMCEGSSWGRTGVKQIDPFAYWGVQKLKTASQAHFLGSNESCVIAEIECGFHGHNGANGARGSLKSFSKIGVKTVTGHGHHQGIDGGAYAVGTSSYPDLEYIHGPSSHMNAHCAIYANGKRALLNMINGRFRA